VHRFYAVVRVLTSATGKLSGTGRQSSAFSLLRPQSSPLLFFFSPPLCNKTATRKLGHYPPDHDVTLFRIPLNHMSVTSARNTMALRALQHYGLAGRGIPSPHYNECGCTLRPTVYDTAIGNFRTFVG